MRLNKKKNSIRNITFGIINKSVTVICPFIMRTILIYTLGSEYLGLSNLFTSILQVLNLTELGIGSAMVFELYKPIADNDVLKICSLLNFYKKIYKFIGLAIFLLGIIFLPFLPIFINGDVPCDVNIYILFILYLLQTCSTYLLFAYKQTILSGYQRRDIISNIGTITHLCLYITQFICLMLFKNYYMYVIWLPLFNIIESIVTGIVVKNKYPQYFAYGNISKSEEKRILSKVSKLFGHKLSNVVTNSVDTIVISTFIGLKMVTIYNNYFYLMSAIVGVLDVVYQGILAGIGNSMILSSPEHNKTEFYDLFFLNSVLVGFCSTCFVCLYQNMMYLWMGENMMLPLDSIILLSVYFYVWQIRKIVLTYKDANGMWEIDFKKPYFEIIINLIINIILVNLIGLNGVIISTIISMVLVSIPWETKTFFETYFKEPVFSYFQLMLKYSLITFIISIVSYSMCSFINNYSVLGFIFRIFICIFATTSMYIIVYNNNIRNLLNKYLKK